MAPLKLKTYIFNFFEPGTYNTVRAKTLREAKKLAMEKFGGGSGYKPNLASVHVAKPGEVEAAEEIARSLFN